MRYYEERAENDGRLLPRSYRARRDAADRFIVREIGPVGTALELGVGTGRLLIKVAATRRIGLDFSSGMCRRSRDREIEVVRADQAAVPFRAAIADAVISGDGAGRYTPLSLFLEQVAHLLCDGGRFGLHLYPRRSIRLSSLLRPWRAESPWSEVPESPVCNDLPPWRETRSLFAAARLRIERQFLFRNLSSPPYLLLLPSPGLFALATEAVLVGTRVPR
jgi:SAM-dependent methyltransferase